MTSFCLFSSHKPIQFMLQCDSCINCLISDWPILNCLVLQSTVIKTSETKYTQHHLRLDTDAEIIRQHLLFLVHLNTTHVFRKVRSS